MAVEPEIAELLALLRSGDQAALGTLFDKHRESLRRMVLVRLDHRLAGRVSASDILQEAFIDASRRVEHYFAKTDQPFFGWLRLIVGQRIADIHREHLAGKRDAGREVGFQGNGADSGCLAGCLAGKLTSPSHAAARGELLSQLEEALEQLDPLDREVLILRHFEEFGNAETAEILGILPAAASKRYVRALVKLRDILAAFPDFASASEGNSQ